MFPQKVKKGIFGAYMKINSTNEGPLNLDFGFTRNFFLLLKKFSITKEVETLQTGLSRK